MKLPCLLCWTLENRAPVIAWESSAMPSQGHFGGLRINTRFSLFRCSECATQWRWSRAKGWHHEGQRHHGTPVLSLRTPMGAPSLAFTG